MGFVDVHAHFVTDWYVKEAVDAGHALPDGMASWPRWAVGTHLELMDRCGIDTAILSVSSPGVHFGDDAAARMLARKLNTFGADAVREHPDRFGLFASLPLPDVEGALAEISYAFDILGADGVILESNVHGIYPGDDRFEPVFAELDRRAAVVFLHPTSPACWQACDIGLPRPVIEFIFDTARSVTDLLLAGTLQRFPRIALIVPHCGGALPVLADRINGFVQMAGHTDAPDVNEQLRQLYYDLAGTPFPHQLPALLSLVGAGQVLYGSDYPWTPAAVAERHASAFSDMPSPAEGTTWQAVTTANARRLLPRMATHGR